MKRTNTLCCLLILLSCFPVMGQNTVTIYQDDRLGALLIKKESNSKEEPAVTCPGFRVQLYSDNHPGTAKADALKMEKKLQEKHPQLRVYVSYNAPFWKVRVGDFTDYYEALLLSKQLKAEWPAISEDIYVQQEEVVKPLYFFQPKPTTEPAEEPSLTTSISL